MSPLEILGITALCAVGTISGQIAYHCIARRRICESGSDTAPSAESFPEPLPEQTDDEPGDAGMDVAWKYPDLLMQAARVQADVAPLAEVRIARDDVHGVVAWLDTQHPPLMALLRDISPDSDGPVLLGLYKYRHIGKALTFMDLSANDHSLPQWPAWFVSMVRAYMKGLPPDEIEQSLRKGGA